MADPSYLEKDRPYGDIRYALVYILIMIFIMDRVFSWRRMKNDIRESNNIQLRRITIFLMVFGIISYIFWQEISAHYRMLIPLELLSPLLIAYLITVLVPLIRVRSHLIVTLSLLMTLFVQPWPAVKVKWTDDFFGVKVPPIRDSRKTLVMIASTGPIAFLIPSFSNEVRFLRIRTNMIVPGQTDKMIEEMKGIVADHKGPIYLITEKRVQDKTLYFRHKEKDLLPEYGLDYDTRYPDQPIIHKKSADWYIMRRLKKIASIQTA